MPISTENTKIVANATFLYDKKTAAKPAYESSFAAVSYFITKTVSPAVTLPVFFNSIV